MDLSIIIVTYNSSEIIENCINSIIDNTQGIEYEIIVVDNDSADNTVEKVNNIERINENVKIVQSINKGFNYGNNRGIEKSSGKYICLLNPDTVLVNNAFKILIEGMENDLNIGACGARLLDKDKNKNITIGSFPSIRNTILKNMFLRRENYHKIPSNDLKVKVDYPIGADFLFRRNILDEIGMLDENYFLYYDETDFAYRIKKANYKLYVFTEAKIIHLQGTSTENISEFAEEKFRESFIYYNKKNLSKWQTFWICSIEMFGNLIKYMVKYVFNIGECNFNIKAYRFYKYSIKKILMDK